MTQQKQPKLFCLWFVMIFIATEKVNKLWIEKICL